MDAGRVKQKNKKTDANSSGLLPGFSRLMSEAEPNLF
jgi:hypothetical protein